MPALLRLARIKQWAKNILVFAAFLFSGRVLDPSAWKQVLIAFFAFGLVSSACYIFNDLADIERDRQHPTKKNRPLASGAVAPSTGLAMGVVLLLAGLALGFADDKWVGTVLVAYGLMQVAYNLWVKAVPVTDVFWIATGFVLRAAVGAQAIHVPISGWLLYCTAAFALMLGFAKRRHEFVLQGEECDQSRASLVHYTLGTLNMYVGIFSGMAAMSYSIYCVSSATAHDYPGILLTAPFVIYAISRYVLLVFSQNEGGEPAEILLHDRHILFSVIGFLIAAAVALKGFAVPIVGAG